MSFLNLFFPLRKLLFCEFHHSFYKRILQDSGPILERNTASVNEFEKIDDIDTMNTVTYKNYIIYIFNGKYCCMMTFENVASHDQKKIHTLIHNEMLHLI